MNRLISWIRKGLKQEQQDDCSVASMTYEYHNDKELFDDLDDRIVAYNQEKHFDRYWDQYQDIHKMALDFEQKGIIAVKGSKHLSYLQEILKNDGPEYCFVIEFRAIYNSQRRYRIGVCVRGRPLVEKL